jgi:hypothetical protein
MGIKLPEEWFMLRRYIVAFSLAGLTAPVWADSLDLNLRNSAIQAQYNSHMGRDTLGKAEFHVGFLYVDNTYDHNSLFDLGLVVKDELGSNAPGVSVGAGVKAMVGHTYGTNESGLALGVLAGFSPPAAPKIGIVGQLYFAPNITTFGDASKYLETGIRLEYAIVPNAAAYVGYRNIQFNLNNGSSNAAVDEGAFVGLRMSF